MFGLGPAILKVLYHLDGGHSSIEHAHPAGVGGGVFPTTLYTTNAGAAALLMHKPKDNGGWDVESHLGPEVPGQANPLTFIVLTGGKTVTVGAGGRIQVLDSDNTVMFEIP